MNQIIRRMQLADVQRAAQIIEGNSISRPVPEEQLEREGFFIKTKSADELKEYVFPGEKNLAAYVLEMNGKVSAVLLAQGISEWRKEVMSGGCQSLDLKPSALDIIADPTTIDYSYVARDLSIKCDVRQLTDYFFEEAFSGACLKTGKANHVIGKIYTSPIANRVSMAYHKRFGVEEIGRLNYRFPNIPGLSSTNFEAALVSLSAEKYAQKRGWETRK